MAGIFGYSKVPDIDEDGWFHTGDIGYYDDKKLVYVTSRIKDVMKYDSYQVV
jgi:4-coumarate--CoA ligase